jgi:hypothetical protein
MPGTKDAAPPEEDPREWLLFDIDDEDTVTAEFLKPVITPTFIPQVLLSSARSRVC